MCQSYRAQLQMPLKRQTGKGLELEGIRYKSKGMIKNLYYQRET